MAEDEVLFGGVLRIGNLRYDFSPINYGRLTRINDQGEEEQIKIYKHITAVTKLDLDAFREEREGKDEKERQKLVLRLIEQKPFLADGAYVIYFSSERGVFVVRGPAQLEPENSDLEGLADSL